MEAGGSGGSAAAFPLPLWTDRLAEVVGTLESDIRDIWYREPHWGIYSQDFKITDQTGQTLRGLDSSKLLWRLLCRMGRKFRVRSDVEFDVVDGAAFRRRGGTDAADAFIMARWHVDIGGPRFRWRFWRRGAPLPIRAEVIFHINLDSQVVDSMQIDELYLNGDHNESLTWPPVVLSDKLSASLKKIDKWAHAARGARHAVQKRPGSDGLFDRIIDRVVDKLLDNLFERVGQDDVDRVVDRLLDRAMARTSDRALDAVFNRQRNGDKINARSALQADLPAIFVRDLNWAYVAEDFKLVDQTGFTVRIGVGPTKIMTYLLRAFHRRLIATPLVDIFEISTSNSFEAGPGGSLEPVLVANWTLKIDIDKGFKGLDMATLDELKTYYLPYLPENYGFPLRFAGEFIFALDSDRKVSSMKVAWWSLNGVALVLQSDFPFLKISKRVE